MCTPAHQLSWYRKETEKQLIKEPLKKGYECIKILIAIRLSRLKGLKMYNEGVALKRKIVLPLVTTINVCGERKKERGKRREREHDNNQKQLGNICNVKQQNLHLFFRTNFRI